jgi:hypothetical protein
MTSPSTRLLRSSPLSADRWSDRIERARGDRALRDSLIAFAGSLALTAISGMGAVLIFGAGNAGSGVFNPPGLASGLGSVSNVLVAPFARWDGVWYLGTALHGYGLPGGSPPGQFFPLYPLLVNAVWHLGVGVVLAGILVSAVATVVALRLIWKLTDYELGDRYPDAPRLAVFATAFFPMAFFLTADYPESLFLACSVGAMWMARHERWAWAGLLGGLATAAHSLGIVMIVPLGLLYLSAHRWRLRFDVLWLALVPAGFGAFMAWLAIKGFDPFSPLTAHKTWLREQTNPFSGLWLATRSAWAGVRQIFSGQSAIVYWIPGISYGYDPTTIARDNLEQFAFLLFAIGGAVAAFRRLPAAYGAYVIAILVVAVSEPIEALPLSGLSRFVLVAFPIMMMIGLWLAQHRRWRLPVLGSSAVLLVYFSGFFATWHWVA